MSLQLDDRMLLPLKDSVVPFSPYVPHKKLRNKIPNRCRPMSPSTSKPTQPLGLGITLEVPNKLNMKDHKSKAEGQ